MVLLIKIIWGQRQITEANKYENLCNFSLRNIYFPTELSKCCDKMYTKKLSKYYRKKPYKLMSLEGLGEVGRQYVGINMFAQREARLTFQFWKSSAVMPSDCHDYDEMRVRKNFFKRKLKYHQLHRSQIRIIYIYIYNK